MYYLFSILFSISIFAATDDLARDPKWIKLLHYKKSLFGNYVSQADGKGFFFATDGRTSPENELKAAIAIFGTSTTPDDNHAICKFPLRYKWLNKKLGMPWKADFSGCRKYIEFFSKLAAKRASIVFSSYYLSNPNTAFGHTLMRLSRYDDSNETEMLDYGINYSAASTSTNPFSYMWKGLFGGFKGEFAAIPYYYKVREYSNFEFRDLWSYNLKMTMSEVLEMVDHIWELSHTNFDYWYFHENCSYHLLSVIDVARPDLNLSDEYHIYTIPADTIRLLDQKGLIENGSRRESTYTKLIRLSDTLSNDDKNLARKISEHPLETNKLIAGIENQKAADILDVSMEAFDYKHFEKILKDDPKTKEIKENILKARAVNPIITKDDPRLHKQDDSPAKSHSPTRATLSQGYLHTRGQYTTFEARAALHDMMDPPQGSLKEAQLELGKLSFTHIESDYGDAKFLFNEVSIFNIKNYPDQNFWSSPISWEVDLGAKQIRQFSCFDCPGAYLAGSVGNSIQLASNKFLLAVLLNGELNVQSQFVNNYRAGLGPRLYSRVRLSNSVFMALKSTYHFNTYEHEKPFSDYEWLNEIETRFHYNRDWSFFLKGGGVEMEREWIARAEMGLQYFY